MSATLRPAANAGVQSAVPWTTLSLAAGFLAVATVTLTADAPTAPEAFAYSYAHGLAPTLASWWLAHADGWHLVANVLVLALFVPTLERFVGPLRTAAAFLAGNLLGAGAHFALNLTDRPLLGASAGLYALVAYSLVVGWHCPYRLRVGAWTLWPATVFYGLLALEVVRWAVGIATGTPSGAAAHLGGVGAGVLASGLAHRRWPGAPCTRRGRGAGARGPEPASA
jgi:membrane associated rhomboid family serine protease